LVQRNGEPSSYQPTRLSWDRSCACKYYVLRARLRPHEPGPREMESICVSWEPGSARNLACGRTASRSHASKQAVNSCMRPARLGFLLGTNHAPNRRSIYFTRENTEESSGTLSCRWIQKSAPKSVSLQFRFSHLQIS
jgi:hypothetical protein